MKKIIAMLSITISIVMANWTRTYILAGGEYLDDPVNIARYPNQIALYGNHLFGDINQTSEDYGLIYEPDRHNVGALGVWQPPETDRGFSIGYGVKLFRFEIGAMISPVNDNLRYGFGISRSYFSRRFELSFLTQNAVDDDWYQFNLRISKKHGDFVVLYRYALDYVIAPNEYQHHTTGIMIQRMVLNDGFVYLTGEYDFSRGDIENDRINVYAGLELPVSRWLVLMSSVHESSNEDFSNASWYIEPGIGIRLRGFNITFHLNKDRLFDKDQTIFKGAGLDLTFSDF